MKHFATRVLLAAMLTVGALVVSGCAVTDPIGSAYTVLTETKVSREAVVVARNAFNAAEVTATNYLSLRRCTGTNDPVCRDPALRAPIVAAVRAGRDARNRLTAFMNEHPGELGPQGLYDALRASTSAIQGLVATYKANR